ncbi:unnamed protein product [Durusdinium trenchii]|uniref:Protein kinase domain-containing protein n=1 Tax=Durusdinium trenchii TaxID=1381693 RepID=A0ABP0S100_9DINO
MLPRITVPRVRIAVLAVLAAAEEVEPEQLKLPNALTCGNQQEWASVAASLSAHLSGPDPTDGLPSICQQLDLDLIKWMVGDVLNPSWSPNTSDAFQDFYEEQYYCDSRLTSVLEAEMQVPCTAVSSSVNSSSCLFGSATIFACFCAMMLRHPEELEEEAALLNLRHSAAAMRWMLESEHRWLEFLDSSDWPINLTEVANTLDALRDALSVANWSLASGARVRETSLRSSRRPWSEGSFSWRMSTLAARQSLAQIASWRASELRAPASSARRAVTMWAFGTHCSVMAEPVSVMSTLLSEEFLVNVTWHGASDYCQYHQGAQPDGNSDVRQLYMQHWRKAGAVEDHRQLLPLMAMIREGQLSPEVLGLFRRKAHAAPRKEPQVKKEDVPHLFEELHRLLGIQLNPATVEDLTLKGLQELLWSSALHSADRAALTPAAKGAEAAKVETAKVKSFHELFCVITRIGEGATGTVILAKDRASEQRRAVKVVHKTPGGQELKEEQLKLQELSFQREVKVLSALDHPHIVRLHQHFEDPQAWYLVLDYCPCGDLVTLMDEHREPSI